MSEYVIIAIKVPKEKVAAYKTVFPDAKVFDMQGKKEPEVLPAPTVEEVLSFCQERNSPVDGARFFEYYSKRGWLDAAGAPIKNWKDKLVEWESNGKNNQKSNRIVTAAEYEASRNTQFAVKKQAERISDFMKWDDEQRKAEQDGQR